MIENPFFALTAKNQFYYRMSVEAQNDFLKQKIQQLFFLQVMKID